MPGEITDFKEIEIAAKPAQVFAYVSRPDLWHEWHPASTSAELPRTPLRTGDAFREIITVAYPLLKIRRQTHYQVTISHPGKIWEVKGESSLFTLTIHYEFVPVKQGTLFRRTLTYAVKGPLSYVEPLLIRPKISRQSAQALHNLQAKFPLRKAHKRSARKSSKKRT